MVVSFLLVPDFIDHCRKNYFEVVTESSRVLIITLGDGSLRRFVNYITRRLCPDSCWVNLILVVLAINFVRIIASFNVIISRADCS